MTTTMIWTTTPKKTMTMTLHTVQPVGFVRALPSGTTMRVLYWRFVSRWMAARGVLSRTPINVHSRSLRAATGLGGAWRVRHRHVRWWKSASRSAAVRRACSLTQVKKHSSKNQCAGFATFDHLRTHNLVKQNLQ